MINKLNKDFVWLRRFVFTYLPFRSCFPRLSFWCFVLSLNKKKKMIRNIVTRAAHQAQRGVAARSTMQQTQNRAAFVTQTAQRMDKNANRPISPHVTIYAFPKIAISSITNRACGAALSVGMAGCGALTLLGVDVTTVMFNLGHSDFSYVCKFGVAFPLVYHYAAGLRHLYWDNTVQGFTNSEMESSSVMLMGSTVVLSGIVAAL